MYRVGVSPSSFMRPLENPEYCPGAESLTGYGGDEGAGHPVPRHTAGHPVPLWECSPVEEADVSQDEHRMDLR